MEFKIIPRREDVPPFDPAETAARYIEDFGAGELTAAEAVELLKQRPFRANWHRFLDPDGEGDFIEVLRDGKWLALGRSDGGRENYYSYNPDLAGVKEPTGLLSGGQSPIEKELALTGIETGVRAAEYFIHTGGLLPPRRLGQAAVSR